MHTAAYFESINSATLTNVAVVQDEVLTELGADTFLIPDTLSEIHAAAALGPDLTRAQIETPSILRRRMNQTIAPIADAAESFRLTNPQIYVPRASIALDKGEAMTFRASEDNAGASSVYGLVWLKDAGALPPIPGGEVRRVRASGTTTLVPDTWSGVKITLDQELEAGRYALINFIATGVSPIAARVNFPDQNDRPGLPAFKGATENIALNASYLSLEMISWYNMGSFSNTALPKFDVLATAADTAQVFYLDMVKIS